MTAHAPPKTAPKRPRGNHLVRDCLLAGWHRLRLPGRSYRGPLPPADSSLQHLDDELRRHVRQLAVEIGERNVSRRPEALEATAEYIASELSACGYDVGRQRYDVGAATVANLEAEIRGSRAPQELVIIGAHYDSVADCPAANDNGSGVAALLSLARHFHCPPSDLARTVRFVAFVNEEAPYAHTANMGSLVYARRCRQRGEIVTAMLSLETIGYYSDQPGSQKYPPLLGWFYPSRGDFIAFIGSTRHPRLVREAVGAFRRNEPFPSHGGALPEAIREIGFSDHWSFWQENYPALMVTDTAPFRYPHYHTPQDTFDKIDFPRMSRVVRGLRGVIQQLAT